MPNGVTVAQLILVQFVEVRILIGQPFFSLFELLNSLETMSFRFSEMYAIRCISDYLAVKNELSNFHNLAVFVANSRLFSSD